MHNFKQPSYWKLSSLIANILAMIMITGNYVYDYEFFIKTNM